MRRIRLVIALLPICAAFLAASPAYAAPTLQALTLSPNPILAGGTSSGTVTLSGPATNDTAVSLSANPANGVTIPGTVTVLTGQTQAQFPIQDLNTSTDTAITATLAAEVRTTHLFVVGALPHLLINEVDYDQAGTDSASFIELYNASTDDVDLSNLAVVLVNGATNTEYLPRTDLSPVGCLASGGYLVIASSSITPTSGAAVISGPDQLGDWIQNGSPDGVALVDTATHTVLDALSYEGSITAAAITGFPGTYNLVEGSATAAADTNLDGSSLSRTPNGQDTDNAANDWALASSTPGGPNGGGVGSVPGHCNRAPNFAAIGDRSVTAGQTLSFTVSATDPDGDPLTYAASNLPSGATFDPATRTFSWTPTALQTGTYPGIHFTANDGNAAPVAQDMTITVNAPTLTSGGGGGSSTPPPPGAAQTPEVVVAVTPVPPPDTRLAKVRVKKHTATASFSGGPGARAFQCKLDKGRFKACRSPKAYKRLGPGKHTLQVRAVNVAGTVDPTPAKRKFLVRR